MTNEEKEEDKLEEFLREFDRESRRSDQRFFATVFVITSAAIISNSDGGLETAAFVLFNSIWLIFSLWWIRKVGNFDEEETK